MTSTPQTLDEEALIKAARVRWQSESGHEEDWRAAKADYIAEAQAMILAYLSSAKPQGEGWRPIESAPKGPTGVAPQTDWNLGECGPFILVAFAERGYEAWSAHTGWWSPRYKCWRFLEDDGPHDVQPTHWQPLPAPPKKDDET